MSNLICLGKGKQTIVVVNHRFHYRTVHTQMQLVLLASLELCELEYEETFWQVGRFDFCAKFDKSKPILSSSSMVLFDSVTTLFRLSTLF